MSVETREPYPMPQPEQWMSEHPLLAVLVFPFAALLVILGAVFGKDEP